MASLGQGLVDGGQWQARGALGKGVWGEVVEGCYEARCKSTNGLNIVHTGCGTSTCNFWVLPKNSMN